MLNTGIKSGGREKMQFVKSAAKVTWTRRLWHVYSDWLGRRVSLTNHIATNAKRNLWKRAYSATAKKNGGKICQSRIIKVSHAFLARFARLDLAINRLQYVNPSLAKAFWGLIHRTNKTVFLTPESSRILRLKITHWLVKIYDTCSKTTSHFSRKLSDREL